VNNRSLAKKFSQLSTPLIADAALGLHLSIRFAPFGTRAVISEKRVAGRALPAEHFGSVNVFLKANRGRRDLAQTSQVWRLPKKSAPRVRDIYFANICAMSVAPSRSSAPGLNRQLAVRG